MSNIKQEEAQNAQRLQIQETRTDDLVLKISLGGLGLVFYLIRDIPLETLKNIRLLQYIIVLYGSAACGVLISYFTSIQTAKSLFYENRRKTFNTITRCLNYFCLICTFFAMILSVAFITHLLS